MFTVLYFTRLIASFKASNFKIRWLFHFAYSTEKSQQRSTIISHQTVERGKSSPPYEDKFKRLNTHHFSSLVTNEARYMSERREFRTRRESHVCEFLKRIFHSLLSLLRCLHAWRWIDSLRSSTMNVFLIEEKWILVNCRFSSVHYTFFSFPHRRSRCTHSLYLLLRLFEVLSLAFLITLRVHSKTGYMYRGRSHDFDQINDQRIDSQHISWSYLVLLVSSRREERIFLRKKHVKQWAVHSYNIWQEDKCSLKSIT